MNHVWIILDLINHEGATVLGVFSSKRKAKLALLRTARRYSPDISISLKDFIDGVCWPYQYGMLTIEQYQVR